MVGQDIFGNCDIVIENSTLTAKGIEPEKNKIGRVILKPKEDQWRLCTYMDGSILKVGTPGVFQATVEEKIPVRLGLGIIEDNKLKPFVWLTRDDNENMHFMTEKDGERLHYRTVVNRDRFLHLNTVGLGYINGSYYYKFNGIGLSLDSHGVFTNVPPVYFVDFDSPLRAVYIGADAKPTEEESYLITERPNYYIKDYNA